MGKVAVVANSGLSIQLNFFWTSFFTASYAQSDDLESIWTSKSFDKRGDKDCHHRSVSGLAFLVNNGATNYRVERTPRGGDPAVTPIDARHAQSWGRTWTDSDFTRYIRIGWNINYLQLNSNMVLVRPTGFTFLCPKDYWIKMEDHAEYGDWSDGPHKTGNPYHYYHIKWKVKGLRAYYTAEEFDGTLLTDYSFVYPGPAGVPLWYHMYGDPAIVTHTVQHGYVEIVRNRYGVAAINRVDESGTVVQHAVAGRTGFFSQHEGDSTVTVTEELFSSIRNYVRLMSHERLNSLQFAAPYGKIPKAEKTELISKAIDDAKVLTINSIAFLRDLKHIKELIVPLLKLRKKPLSAKAWANLWLSYEYGIRLLIQDVHEIVTKIPKSTVKFGLTHVRAASRRTVPDDYDRETEVLYHCKVILNPKIGPIVSVLDKLRRLDLVVSRENLWDFVPYSFVLDWFVPIGETLAHLDLREDIDLFGADVAILSSKATRSLSTYVHRYHGDQEFNIQLALSFKVYNRWHEDPTISVPTIEFANGLNIRRGADGFALLVQKIKP